MACVLIEPHDEWQDGHRRYLSEGSMALLNPPAPTATETKKTPAEEEQPTLDPRYGIVASLAKQHATSYTRPGGRAITD